MAPPIDLRNIKSFPQLVKYLRDELDWPIESSDFEELTFDYAPEELGLDSGTAAKIKEIKQLRPLESKQPWGIFFVNFEPQRLPVVALRRILRSLVVKKRHSANKSQQAAWQLHDLLFISAYGEAAHRDITFAHFAEESEHGDLPVLRVLGWDDEDTALHTAYTDKMLRERLCWPKDTNDVEKWRATWSAAFTLRHLQVVRTSKELALRLAELAQKIRKRAKAVLALENDKGQLRKLNAAFKEALIHDLSQDDFADMYAQTISYGLLTARISRPSGIIADNLTDMVPVTNPFLKELLETFLNVGGRKGKIDFDELGISEVVQLLRDADMEAVLRDFGDRNPEEDPAIHFYELFLKEFDPKKRMQRGVFYTPRPVVSFIIRSVHELLQREFGLTDGLADISTWGEMASRHKGLKIPDGVSADEPFVKVLDPATGTGTFLVETIDVIYETMRTKWLKEGHMVLEIPNLWNQYVPRHLLPKVYGYELLMAPYAIAHMKIGLKLHETGYRFGSEERARIYLTNSLEPAGDDKKQREFEEWAPALAHEAQAVNEIKRGKRFTVLLGNPPYSNFGQLNKIPFILELLSDYKRDLNERKLNLDDDFIKFLRYGQWQVDQTGAGILAFISANSYLDGAGHRRMRRLLMNSFGMIRIVNLHGNLRKKEVGPSGAKEENVFDIMQGVAIGLMCKTLSKSREQLVEYGDIWGCRSEKYKDLSLGSIIFNLLDPQPEQYLLTPQKNDFVNEYRGYSSLKDIFADSGQGIEMGRTVALAYSKRDMETVVSDLENLTNLEFSHKYDVPVSSATWGVERARNDVLAGSCQFMKLMIRPFDEGWTLYTGRAGGFHHRPRTNSTTNMLLADNRALVAKRQSKESYFSSIWVVDKPINQGFFSIDPLGRESLFPLYRSRTLSSEQPLLGIGTEGAKWNIVDEGLRSMGTQLVRTEGLSESLVCVRIFDYIYAVLHSPCYRSRYAECLKIEFPRLPFPGSLDLFRNLARCGEDLVSLHLLQSTKLDKLLTAFTGPAKPEVEKVSYVNETVWLDKAQSKGFRGVPENVWNFHIGGYQVCEKWLKDRKGRILSQKDIDHYQRIIVALSETIKVMAKIDKVIEAHGGWPGAFATGQPSTIGTAAS